MRKWLQEKNPCNFLTELGIGIQYFTPMVGAWVYVNSNNFQAFKFGICEVPGSKTRFNFHTNGNRNHQSSW